MMLEKPILISLIAVILSAAAITSSVVLRPAPFLLENGAVGSAELANDAVTTVKIADNAVDSDKLADNAVTTNDIANSAVTGSKIASDAVDDTKIASGAVGTTELADNAVTSAKILPSAVDGTRILDNSIRDADINDAAGIAGSKLANYSVTNLQLDNNCVTENKLAIKIKAGMTAAANGGTIAHGLGAVPTSVSLTLENRAATTDNFVIYVRGLNAENITVGITKNGVAHGASENIYWIAIYTP